MAAPDLTASPAPATARAAYRQFPTAWRFAVRNQTRNRFAFLQNPLGNPLANKPLLEWFPAFGPTQFAIGASLGRTLLWQDLAIGLAWPAAFAAAGLIIFRIRTGSRVRTR